MSNLLLEKVEELTLHLIRLEKENEKLKALLLESNKDIENLCYCILHWNC